MKIREKEKEEQPEIKFEPGDQIRIDYDDHSAYFMIIRTREDNYALVSLASTDRDDTWFERGNLSIDGTATVGVYNLKDSIEDLMGSVYREHRKISKVNLALVEE